MTTPPLSVYSLRGVMCRDRDEHALAELQRWQPFYVMDETPLETRILQKDFIFVKGHPMVGLGPGIIERVQAESSWSKVDCAKRDLTLSDRESPQRDPDQRG